MNIRITAALRTVVSIATILITALAINLSVSYLGIQTMLGVGLACLFAWIIYLVYSANLDELKSKASSDKNS